MSLVNIFEKSAAQGKETTIIGTDNIMRVGVYDTTILGMVFFMDSNMNHNPYVMLSDIVWYSV